MVVIVEQVHVQIIIVNKCACDKWFREVRNWDCEMVDSNFVVDNKFAFLNFSFSSSIFSTVWFAYLSFLENTEFENTIINKTKRKLGSVLVLFNIFHFDI